MKIEVWNKKKKILFSGRVEENSSIEMFLKTKAINHHTYQTPPGYCPQMLWPISYKIYILNTPKLIQEFQEELAMVALKGNPLV